MPRWMRSVLLVVSVSLGLVLAPAVPASAHGVQHRAEVTSGSFVTLATGANLGYTVRGHAILVRVGDRTLVGVHVRIQVPEGPSGVTYPTHVHNKACAAPDFGGSHYQHDIGGAVDADNEIWPTVQTNHRGLGLGFATHDHRARPEAMSIVIHQPLTNVRLACVDLS